MKQLLSLILVITFTTNGDAQSPNGNSHTPGGKFDINGTLSGFTDSTWLYLDAYEETGSYLLDSTIVIGNKFHLSGSIGADVVQALIKTKDLSDYKFLWLECAHITFNAEKNKFRDAIITGSKTQDEQNQLLAAIKVSGKEKEEDIAFVRSHPNSIVSANLLSVYASTWGKDTTLALYNSLSGTMKYVFYSKKTAEFIKLNKGIKLGDKFADFTQSDIEGKEVSLSDYKGKIVLLEFWGSWCGPCRAGNPALVKTYNKYKAKGFDIMGVAADDDKDTWLDAVRKDSLPWKNVSDLKGDANKAVLIYGITKFPSNFLIDRNGIVIAQDLRDRDLDDKLDELLKQTK